MQTSISKRRNKLQAIRVSIQANLTIKTNTKTLQSKIENRRKRRQSVVFDDHLTESQRNLILEQDDIQIKTMTKFNEKYRMGDKIGEGSNGLVKKCYLKSTDQIYAVKAIKMDEEHIVFLKKNFKQIRSLDHPNVIKYKAMYLDYKNKICYLIMDYETSPSLKHYKDLSEDSIKCITQQLLDTLAYIHSRNICHRDIKPQNILYNPVDKKIKIIDFGISKNIENRGNKKDMLTITGTLYYRAPQMFLGGGYDEKVDVWAAGITLFQMVTRKTPFQSEYLSTTIQNISKAEVQFQPHIWDQFSKSSKDLVMRLLKKRQERFTAEQAKKHFWFNKRPSINNDLTKSDSLSLKIGQFTPIRNQKYSQDADKYQTTVKIPKLSIKLSKKSIDSEDSDNLIEIESDGEHQIDSPNIAPKKPSNQRQTSQLKLNECENEEMGFA